jgi:hypothetical protein
MGAALAVTGLTLLGGCGGTERAFRRDDAVRVVAPADGATVTLPVAVRWSVDAGGVAGARRYALFVDRAPMPAGHDLSWLARDDDGCRRAPSCPDEAWLNDHAVYTATSPDASVRAVPSSVLGDRTRSDGGHRVVIVPLDAKGRRIGEQAASRLFFVAGR